jgi:tetratricopeptide (TPR) repeat protein
VRLRAATLLAAIMVPTLAPAAGQGAAEPSPSVVEATGGNAGSPGAGTADVSASAEQAHEHGVRLLREHQIDAAIQALRQAVALDEKSALYLTDLGYAYLKQRHLVEAENAFKKAILLNPNRPHAYEHLEQSVTQQSQRWEKRQELLRILEQGIDVIKEPELRLRLELSRIRAERSFGLVERARGQIEELLREKKLPRAIEKQLRELRASIEQDKKARALRDWPEPSIDPRDQERLAQCAQTKDPERRKKALNMLTELTLEEPAWRAPRSLRAEILAEQGHYDEAVKEFTVLTRLAPSVASYHRQLGLLLAEHGGLLELERADEALKNALILEPEWSELEQIRQKLAARRYDPEATKRKASQSVPRPTDNAIRLYNEAEDSLDEEPRSPAAAKELVEQALRESPGYVEAAVLLFALTRHIPEATVTALWNDAAGMYALYQEFSRADPPAPRAELDSWLNRAIELGHVEGRLTRALNQKHQGDMALAELELTRYLALVSNQEEVEAVQLLRAELGDKRHDPRKDAILNARWRLEKDDPEGALRALDAPCRAAMEPERLLNLGIVYERLDKGPEALGCYELQLTKAEENEYRTRIGRRAARLLARGDAKLLAHPVAARLPQLAASEPAALWALARRALEAGAGGDAMRYVTRYLAEARADDRFVAAARELQQRLQSKELEQQQGRRRQARLLLGSVGTGLGLLGLVFYLVMFRGSTVARAIRRRPRLFPELARIVRELRHDVLKHRTSALELLQNEQTNIETLRSTMLEPIPTSTMVTEAYARLATRGRACGITLRRLAREPVFGGLVKDLLRAEAALTGKGDRQTILDVDARLRSRHSERLNQLMMLGPRCQLNAAELERWIAALGAEMAGPRQVWTVPALKMSDLNLWCPIEKAALLQIFANLLRNAEIAVGGVANPKIQVSLVSDLDFTGKPLVRLQIADNAPGELTEETVESQDPGRGLGIVRDTARDWNGQLVILPEGEPYRKSVGVQFAQ